MDLPSNEVVQTAVHALFFTVDPIAPTKLSDELKCCIKKNPYIMRLSERNQNLTRIKQIGFSSIQAAQGKSPLYEEKMKAFSELNRAKVYLLTKLKIQARKRHFRHADTDRFNQQFGNSPACQSMDKFPKLPPKHQILERDQVIELACAGTTQLTEDQGFTRRLQYIVTLVELQQRKEIPCRGRHKHAQPLQQCELSPIEVPVIIPETYQSTQCPFCIGDLTLPRGERMRCLSKVNKLWDHVEKLHRLELDAFTAGDKQCPICNARGIHFAPQSIREFKNHTQRVHSIRLRP
jgi:hypothetical protein